MNRVTLGVFDANIPDNRDLPEGEDPLKLLRGSRPALNIRMARKLAVAVKQQMNLGLNPAQAIAKERGELTLGELFDAYVEDRRANGKRTVDGMRWQWERYLGQLPNQPRKPRGAKREKAPGSVNWQNKRLSEVTNDMVYSFRLRLGEKVGHATANRVLALLSAMYGFAKARKGFTGSNPVENINKFKENERERFIYTEEAPRFIEALEADPDDDFRDYVLLSVFTGARQKNVLRMRWDEVDLDRKVWKISGETMKNGDPLQVAITAEVEEVLRRRAKNAKSEWVLPGGCDGHMGRPGKKWEAFRKVSGLRDLWMHDLRRTLGSYLIATGASTTTAMRALGHKTTSAALRYQRLQMDTTKTAVQTAASGFMAAARAPKPENVVTMPKRKAAKSGR